MPDRRKVGLAILLMVGATLCFAALDATSKYLSRTYPIPMMVWGRYTFHCLMMLIFLAPSMRLELVATTRPVAQITRALMLTGTTGFSMAGFSLMPLAESTAFLFVTPLVVVILSHWLLKESITRGHWIAVLAGFGGALLIARPGGALNAEGIVWMTLAAACYAIYQIQTRQLSPTENTLTMLFYTALVGTVAMTLAAPLYWGGPTPGWIDAALIASLGIYGGTGHLMLTRAFRYAAASFLSPFLYGQLIWAGLLGWMFYDHLPDLLSIAGMVVIAGSSLSIALGERLRRRA
ncbi:MAG: DMT family transporter [Sulfuritalea sp.]|jgi:drug/metabolite transporter (DMT)-like permease|nr:DMT family transporter [Sulfuritalea sp.]MBP7423839.1 DMT family transporter [Sulfuritalea sp.]